MNACERCGQHHTKRRQPDGRYVYGEADATACCTGHRMVDGVPVPCGNYPLRGGTVCRYHGGAAPQVQRANALRRQTAAMDVVLAFALKDVPPDVLAKSPDEQLLEEVGRSALAVEWLAERVAELKVPEPTNTGEFADLVGIDEEGEPIRLPPWGWLFGPDHNGDLAPHVLWSALDRERDRHAKLCKLAIDAGISERLVRLAETQAQAVVSVIRRVIESLGLDMVQREAALRLAAQALRDGGPVAALGSGG